MMYMGQAWPRQPIPVRCDGWVSDTLTLERHGYKFLVDRNVATMTYRIAIGKNGAKSCIMIPEMHYEQEYLHGSSTRPLEFHGEFLTVMEIQETKVFRENHGAISFVQKDMNDAYWCEQEVMMGMTNRRIDIRDLFPQSEKSETGIVLPDTQTLNECLDLILTKQQPRMEEIKRNQKRRDLVEKTGATLITLEKIA